jgi:hypothetical protein
MAAVYALVWTLDEDLVFLYIGSSRHLNRRKQRHFRMMRTGWGVNAAVRRMVKDHGLPEWVVIERVRASEPGGPDDRVILARERHWVEYYVGRLGRSHVLNEEFVPLAAARLGVRLERA